MLELEPGDPGESPPATCPSRGDPSPHHMGVWVFTEVGSFTQQVPTVCSVPGDERLRGGGRERGRHGTLGPPQGEDRQTLGSRVKNKSMTHVQVLGIKKPPLRNHPPFRKRRVTSKTKETVIAMRNVKSWVRRGKQTPRERRPRRAPGTGPGLARAGPLVPRNGPTRG